MRQQNNRHLLLFRHYYKQELFEIQQTKPKMSLKAKIIQDFRFQL